LPGEIYNLVGRDGRKVSVPLEGLADALDAGYRVETQGEGLARAEAEGQAADYGGARDAIEAGIYGVARGASLGLSDVILRGAGAEDEARNLEKAFPKLSTAAEIGGGVGAAILSGGTSTLGRAAAATPTGAVSRAALGLGERIAGPGSTARYITGMGVGGAAEGAAQGVGSYISDVALENKELSAEAFVGSAGQGALWGGIAGGALAGVERGTLAARRLFPRSQVGDREAVDIAEQTFATQAQRLLDSGQDMGKTARSTLDDLRIRNAELNLEREQLKGSKDAASRVRMKEIAVEKAKLGADRKALIAQQNAERAAKGLPDLPESTPQAPILDDAAPTTGPPVDAPAPSSLEQQLLATQQGLDAGIPLGTLSGSPLSPTIDDAIAASNRAHEAGMIADDAVKGGASAERRLAQKLDDFEQSGEIAAAFVDPARMSKGDVKDWIAGLKAKAGPQRYRYENTDGSRIGGGAGRKTDRVRDAFDDGIVEQGSVYDRVWAGIGDDAADATKRAGRELDDEYDALIARAANADGPDDLAKIAKQAGDLEDEIFARVEARGGRDAEEVAKIRANRAKYEWSSSDVAARRAEKLAVAEPGPKPLSGKMAAEQADIAAFERAMRENQFGSGATAGELAAEMTGGALSKPGRLVEKFDAGGTPLRIEVLTKKAISGEPVTEVRALRRLSDGEEVVSGSATFKHRGNELSPADVTVEPALQRKGVASKMYELVEKQTGGRVIASETQTADGKALSEAFRGKRDMAAAPKGLADQILEASRPVEPPSMGRFIDDADAAIKAIGDHERNMYELTKEMGPSAPPAMQQHAMEYEKALADQARRETERMAQAADDAARSQALVSLPKPQAAARGKGGAGKALDAFAALETVNEVANVIPGMPDVRNIPVVGPMLSLYLKYRAGRAAISRLGGRIPATAEAKVAARGAEMRDKLAGVVDRILDGASKGAKVARKPAVVGGAKLIDAIRHPLFPDGEERKEQKTPVEALKARVKELSAAAADPERVKAAVRKQVPTDNPDVAAAIEAVALRKILYLQKHAPRMPPPGPLGMKPWQPSTSEIERFARRVRAAEDPATVIEDFEAGTLTPEAADTLRAVYPLMFAEVQTRLLTRAAELEAKLPYQKVLQASLLFDVPLDSSLLPQNVAALQEAHSSQAATDSTAAGSTAGQPPAPPTPSVARPVNLGSLYETAEMRRATRR
jgi:hypothetical protein